MSEIRAEVGVYRTDPLRRKEGVQTLVRGLTLMEAVGSGLRSLEEVAARTGLSRSTAYRLLAALCRKGYLRHVPQEGYFLGPRLIELGFKAHAQLHLPSVARPHLEWLSQETGETVHLAILDGTEVVYVDKVPGRRELQMSSYIGVRLPAQSTALGKALVAGRPSEEWAQHFVPGLKRTERTIETFERFCEELERVREQGYSVDLEENERGIRCIGAPIFDAGGRVVAAVSLSSAVVYLDEERIPKLAPLVMEAARRISSALGWSGRGREL